MPTRLLIAATVPHAAAAGLIVLRWVLFGVWWPWLGFNLLLGWLPLLFAFLAGPERRGWHLWAVLWLLFLPNAPYLVSDVIHYGERPPVPSWFDAAMIGAVAAAGLLGGSMSAVCVSRTVGRALSWPARMLGGTVVCVLCGRAIELGRVQRHNSWDVLLDPLPVLSDLLHSVVAPHHHLQAWGITLVYAGLVASWWWALSVWSTPPRAGSTASAPDHPGPTRPATQRSRGRALRGR